MRKRVWNKVFVSVVSLVLVAGCGFQSVPQPAAPSAVVRPGQQPVTGQQSSSAQKEKLQLSIGSTAASSGTYAYFVALAEVINANVPEVNVTVVETGAGTENTRRLASGGLDIALSGSPDDYNAYNGLGEYQGKPFKDLRTLWYFGVNAQHYVVREDSGVKTLQDLTDKSFSPGGAGTLTERNSELFFEALGIKPKFVRGSISDAVSSVKDRRAIGYAKGGVAVKADSTILDLQTSTKIRALGFSDQQIAILQQKFPAQSWVTIPAGSIPGIDYEYKTWAAALNIAGTTKLSDDLAYKIVKVVSEQKDRQVQAYPALKDVDVPTMTVQLSRIPLHPGAVKYFEEKGVKVPAELKK